MIIKFAIDKGRNSPETSGLINVSKIILGWIWWCFTRRKIKNIKIFFTLHIYFELLAHPQEYMDQLQPNIILTMFHYKPTPRFYKLVCRISAY